MRVPCAGLSWCSSGWFGSNPRSMSEEKLGASATGAWILNLLQKDFPKRHSSIKAGNKLRSFRNYLKTKRGTKGVDARKHPPPRDN